MTGKEWKVWCDLAFESHVSIIRVSNGIRYSNRVFTRRAGVFYCTLEFREENKNHSGPFEEMRDLFAGKYYKPTWQLRNL